MCAGSTRVPLDAPAGRSYHQPCSVTRLPRKRTLDRTAAARVLASVAAAVPVLVLAPSAVVLARWKERGRLRRRDTESPDRDSGGEGDEEGPPRLELALARALDAQQAAALLFDAVEAVPGVEVALLALLEEDGRRASGFAARGADASWWRGVAIDLADDAGGIATATREQAAFAVDDLDAPPNANDELASSVGAKSAAFVPLVAEAQVVGVLVVAATERRFFSSAQLEALQALADAAAPAIQKMRSADALRRALEREKVVAEIARKVRATLDLDSVLETAVAEAGRAFGVARCFIRLGAPGEPSPVEVQWNAPGLERIDVAPERLAVSNLALREGRTVALGDVLNAPELDDDPSLDRGALLELGTRAALATPIVVFDRTIGAFILHRTETGAWSASDIAVVEAVAGELGLAIHAAAPRRG